MKNRWPCMIVLVLLTLSASAAYAAPAPEPVTIYVDGYPGNRAVSYVARRLIEEHFHTQVNLKQVSAKAAFKKVAGSDNAAFLTAWLPTVHGDYMNEVRPRVRDLGKAFEAARIGWAVPDYVPREKLEIIPDLKKPEVMEKLPRKIQGIDPDSGEMRLSRRAMKAYALDSDYKLVASTGKAMVKALGKAIDRHEWIVVTAWNPHWMWSRWKLRYLEDPKGIFGGAQHADIIVGLHFDTRHPAVYDFLSRLRFPPGAIKEMLLESRTSSYSEAAKRYIESHPRNVHYWITGQPG